MSWLFALAGGIGMGLASFGGLWLTVRQVVRQPRYRIRIMASQAARLALLSLGFYAVGRAGPGAVVCALGGLLIAKWYLVLSLGRSFSHE
jgi:F1F0 ATPase subunit 2